MSTFESRRFKLSLIVGTALTVVALLAQQAGLLGGLDDFFYDQRARYCQIFTPRPDDRIVHIDIDDAAVDPGGVGRWPWKRGTLARILDEIALAKPAAIGLDLHLTERSTEVDTEKPATTEPSDQTDDDTLLAKALARQKNLVLAGSFRLALPRAESDDQKISLELMSGDLELGFPEFYRRAQARGVSTSGDFEAQDLYVHALSEALNLAVQRELSRGSLDDSALIARLLPHTDPAVNTPAKRILLNAADAFRSRREFERFGSPSANLNRSIALCDFDWVPRAEFSRSAAFCGFVNYELLPSPNVRSLPLLVEAGGRYYPQFGFAFACAILGVDPRDARIDKDELIVTAPHGSLHIPIHVVRSSSQDRDVNTIADIPWFGTSNWATMYDWPKHKNSAKHVSANTVWEVCRTVDKIRSNNTQMDRAIQVILGDGDDTVAGLMLDEQSAKNFKAMNLAPDDASRREEQVRMALKELEAAHWLESYAQMKPAEMTADEQTAYDNLKRSKAGAELLLKSSDELQRQLKDLRLELEERLKGKGVLFGSTTEGAVDMVPTSLHNRCPGVVVHGLVAESVLSGRWWRRAPGWIAIVLVTLLGVTVSLLVASFSPLRALGVIVILIVGYLLMDGYVLFDYAKWIVPVAGPITAIAFVWSGTTLQRVIMEGIERNRVATEVAIINREMELARKVQAALIPKAPPLIPTLEADGWTLAASTTGGDCYDLWALADGRLAILLADASGHGLAPAMVVSQVRTLVRALSEVELHPHELLKRVNARVGEDLEPGRFVTAFLGYLSPEGLLEYASAAHGPQFWYTENDPELHLLDSTGAPLGADTEWLCDDPLPPIQIPEGGSLIIFSDGIFEALDPKGALFGLDRLTDLLGKYRGQSGKKIIEQLIEQVQTWQQTHVPADDQTIVVARRIGKG